MDIRYYEVQENSDQMEGRGHMRTVSNFFKIDDAINDARGRGVMGVGSGDIVEVSITVNNDDTVSVDREKIFGYRQDPSGLWGYGFMDFRDQPDPKKDPEYREYLRLRRKFDEAR